MATSSSAGVRRDLAPEQHVPVGAGTAAPSPSDVFLSLKRKLNDILSAEGQAQPAPVSKLHIPISDLFREGKEVNSSSLFKRRARAPTGDAAVPPPSVVPSSSSSTTSARASAQPTTPEQDFS